MKYIHPLSGLSFGSLRAQASATAFALLSSLATGCANDESNDDPKTNVDDSTTGEREGEESGGSDDGEASEADSNPDEESGDSSESPEDEIYAWEVEGHQWILAIQGNEFAVLEYTPISCLVSMIPGAPLLGPLEYLPALIDFDDEEVVSGNDFQGRFHSSLETTHFRALDSLPEPCAEELTLDYLEEDYQPNALDDFDIVWTWFEQNYAFMDLHGVDWAAQRDQYRGMLSEDSSDEDLSAVLMDMLAPLDDGHVNLFTWTGDIMGDGDFDSWSPEKDLKHEARLKDEFQEEMPGGTLDEYVEEVVETFNGILLDLYLDSEIKSAGEDQIQWAKLKNENIGYITISSMSDYTEDASAADDVDTIDDIIENILEDFRDTDGIILDIRTNDGGYDGVSFQIASHFTDESRKVLSKQNYINGELSEEQSFSIEPSEGIIYTKPVALLISDDSSSAAEIFSMAMGELPQVLLLGEATNGGLSDMMIRRTTRRLAFSLSFQVYKNAKGEVLEGIGVVPDEEFHFLAKSDRDAEKDSAMDRAIEFIKE